MKRVQVKPECIALKKYVLNTHEAHTEPESIVGSCICGPHPPQRPFLSILPTSKSVEDASTSLTRSEKKERNKERRLLDQLWTDLSLVRGILMLVQGWQHCGEQLHCQDLHPEAVKAIVAWGEGKFLRTLKCVVFFNNSLRLSRKSYF